MSNTPDAYGLDTRKVVGEAKRSRNRKRTKRQEDLRRINAIARARQQAWLETRRSDLTGRLTAQLDREYAALRDDRSNDPLPVSWTDVNDGTEGTGLERLPYFGR